ncbi:MAG: hypothetical protein ACNA8H_13220, partial [Anaerolineales bacterium]
FYHNFRFFTDQVYIKHIAPPYEGKCSIAKPTFTSPDHFRIKPPLRRRTKGRSWYHLHSLPH